MSWHNVSEIIQEHIDARTVGGAAVCILRDGEVKVCEGFGADRSDSIYKIYSMTKLFTSVITLQLAEEGVLALCDPVAKYLPEFKDHLVYDTEGQVEVEKTPLTIQHLLNMTSGIPYPFPGTEAQRRMMELEAGEVALANAGHPFTTVSACKAMAQVPGGFEPGKSWDYGAGADLLGGVLEVATGMTLDVLYQQRLFGPLRMTDTGFCIPVEKVGRAATQWHRHPRFTYAERDDTYVRSSQNVEYLTYMAPSNGIDTVPPAFLAAGGGCYSTASDYARFLQMLLNEGELNGVRVLKPETVRFMRTPQLSDEQLAAKSANQVGAGQPGYSYSNLVRILVDPSQARALGVNGHVGEFGWDGAGGNFNLVDPESNTAAVFMMHNYEGSEPVLRRRLYMAIVADD